MKNKCRILKHAQVLLKYKLLLNAYSSTNTSTSFTQVQVVSYRYSSFTHIDIGLLLNLLKYPILPLEYLREQLLHCRHRSSWAIGIYLFIFSFDRWDKRWRRRWEDPSESVVEIFQILEKFGSV